MLMGKINKFLLRNGLIELDMALVLNDGHPMIVLASLYRWPGQRSNSQSSDE